MSATGASFAEYERRMKAIQMRADIRNKNADTAYKLGLLRFEPWKLVVVSIGAGVALLAAVQALLKVAG